MDNVDIMRTFLEQQSGTALFFRAVMAEVTAAVTDEVPAPHALDLSDDPRIDHLFEFQDKIHVAHIVSDHQFAAGTVSSFQNAVTPLKGDSHGFFQKDVLTRFQSGDSHLFMETVSDHDENCFNILIFDKFAVIGILFYPRQIRMGLTECFQG